MLSFHLEINPELLAPELRKGLMIFLVQSLAQKTTLIFFKKWICNFFLKHSIQILKDILFYDR